MALEFIARLLLGTLSVLGVDVQIGAQLLCACLALQAWRRGHGLILANDAVPAVVVARSVIIGNALPPQGGVVERQRGKEKPVTQAAPAPTGIEAIAAPAATVAEAPTPPIRAR